jgi:hypothetical protein
MPIILAIRRLRHEDRKFEASLGYVKDPVTHTRAHIHMQIRKNGSTLNLV